jgi:5-methylcytosine-specific restriction endonuclease McrA
MPTVAECLDYLRERREALEKRRKRGSAKAFYASLAWKRLRYQVLRESNGRCQYCGASPGDGITTLQVDHVVAISKDWSRRLDRTNLVCACGDCNHGKLAGPAIDLAARDANSPPYS